MRLAGAVALALAVAGCGARATAPVAEGPAERLAAEGEAWTRALYDFSPELARGLGLHAWDGRVPDRSAQGIARFVEETRARQAVIEAIPEEALIGVAGGRARAERQVLLGAMREQRFDLERRRSPFRNPMHYAQALEISGYLTRDYAPIGERVKGVLATCAEAPRILGEAQANLEPRLPRTFVDTALLQLRGQIAFLKDDVPKTLAGLDPAVRTTVDVCLASLIDDLGEFVTFLERRLPETNDGYALGEEAFVEMLAATQGVALDVPALERIAQADLDRNLAAIAAEAAKIAPGRPVADVVHEAALERVPADKVLAEATSQAEGARAFLLEKKIVSIPSPDVAEVRETPPFMRYNSAFLDPAGPFETRPLPSFYYISPPDPSWPKAEQDAYLPPRTDLLFTTVHEVWPGHFLHGLHMKANPSSFLKSHCTYTMVEGWAHYTEEMMFDAGFGAADDAARAKLHIGQLKEALLRNVRFLVAIGLHARHMTVDEATALFVEKAYADPATARQQAVRGTFDPMFLSYTLGKLAIKKLAADWMARQPGATLGAFHDAFLGWGCAPLPVIRRELLGDTSPVL